MASRNGEPRRAVLCGIAAVVMSALQACFARYRGDWQSRNQRGLGLQRAHCVHAIEAGSRFSCLVDRAVWRLQTCESCPRGGMAGTACRQLLYVAAQYRSYRLISRPRCWLHRRVGGLKWVPAASAHRRTRVSCRRPTRERCLDERDRRRSRRRASSQRCGGVHCVPKQRPSMPPMIAGDDSRSRGTHAATPGT